MSFLQDLFTKTQQIISSSSAKGVVGIDIGTSTIKVVQVAKERGVIKLETYGVLALGPYAQELVGKVVTLTPDVIATAIKDILAEANVTTKVAVFSIQSQATLIFLMELPHVPEAELASIVPNEARKYIPVALTEVSLDWYVVPQKQTYTEEHTGAPAKIEVVVVAVRNETLAQYRDIHQKTGLETRGNEIEVFSTIRSVFHREIAPVLLVDCGAATTKVSIIEYGVVRVYHVINRGSAFITESIARTLSIDFDKAEALKREVGMQDHPTHTEAVGVVASSMQYLINEIHTVLLQYERQSHNAITKIILSGGGAHTRGFQEEVNRSFGVETVLGDPFDKVDAPEFMRPVLKEAGPEFAVATGLALKDFI
jgi:type IV pilus assembly protein PilM